MRIKQVSFHFKHYSIHFWNLLFKYIPNNFKVQLQYKLQFPYFCSIQGKNSSCSIFKCLVTTFFKSSFIIFPILWKCIQYMKQKDKFVSNLNIKKWTKDTKYFNSSLGWFLLNQKRRVLCSKASNNSFLSWANFYCKLQPIACSQ